MTRSSATASASVVFVVFMHRGVVDLTSAQVEMEGMVAARIGSF